MRLRVFRIACFLMAAGVASVALADELDDSLAALKEAQAKKDAALIKKLGAETSALAKKAIETPAPAAADEKEAWKAHVDYAKNVQLQADYIVYSLAAESEPETTLELMAALEQQNPKSKYLDEGGYATYFTALERTGASAKVIPIAEKALASLPDCPDLLFVLANAAARKQQSDKTLTYSNRLTATMTKRSKPEGMSAADWEKKKNELLGGGYYMAGMVYGQRDQYVNADKTLRAALPFIKGTDAMMGPALYYLGVANYKLGMMTNAKAKVQAGVDFSEQSAKIVSPLQSQALKNSWIMKGDLAKMR